MVYYILYIVYNESRNGQGSQGGVALATAGGQLSFRQSGPGARPRYFRQGHGTITGVSVKVNVVSTAVALRTIAGRLPHTRPLGMGRRERGPSASDKVVGWWHGMLTQASSAVDSSLAKATSTVSESPATFAMHTSPTTSPITALSTLEVSLATADTSNPHPASPKAVDTSTATASQPAGRYRHVTAATRRNRHVTAALVGCSCCRCRRCGHCSGRRHGIRLLT